MNMLMEVSDSSLIPRPLPSFLLLTVLKKKVWYLSSVFMTGIRIERVVEWLYFCVGAEEPAVAACEEEDGEVDKEEGEEEEGEGCSG